MKGIKSQEIENRNILSIISKALDFFSEKVIIIENQIRNVKIKGIE